MAAAAPGIAPKSTGPPKKKLVKPRQIDCLPSPDLCLSMPLEQAYDKLKLVVKVLKLIPHSQFLYRGTGVECELCKVSDRMYWLRI